MQNNHCGKGKSTRLQFCLNLGLVLSLMFSRVVFSQTPTGSDIWIGRLDVSSKQVITDLVRVTNNDAYTNQPYFFSNSSLYYTQMLKEDEVEQTDVVKFNIDLGTHKNLTQSEHSEYSPTPYPKKPTMTVIKVNKSGKQELWEIDLFGKALHNVAPNLEPVGYQVWLNENELLLFVLGEPHTLQRVKLNQNGGIFQDASVSMVDDSIGASLTQYKKSKWVLYSKTVEGNWIYGYHTEDQSIKRFSTLPLNSDYFTVSPSGYLFTGNNTGVQWRELAEKTNKLSPVGDWKSIKLPNDQCNKGVSRIAVSPDESMIALVCSR